MIEVRAVEVGGAKVGTSQVGVRKVGPIELEFGHVFALQRGRVQGTIAQVGTDELLANNLRRRCGGRHCGGRRCGGR